MRDEKLYLNDIIDAADAIGRFLGSMNAHEFARDDLVSSAVLQKMAIIGEAAARLLPEFRTRYPDVPWRKVIGLRNILVHAYFTLDLDLIWRTASVDVPRLRDDIAGILLRDYT